MATPPKPFLASSLLSSLTTNNLPTSCPTIDKVLKGGLSYGTVTSILGPVPSTRTLIGMHIFASHLLSTAAAEAIWVDTTGAFAGGRLKDVIFSRLQLLLQEGKKEEEGGEEVLARAKIARAFDLEGLAETLHEIRTDHERRLDGQIPELCPDSLDGVRLVVVDDISLPYASMVNRSLVQGQATMVTVQRALTALSREFKVAVLLLNNVPPPSAPPPPPNPRYRHYSGQHYTFQSRFEAVSWRLAHGPTYAYGADLHILLSVHPYTAEPPGRTGTTQEGDANVNVGVFEVLVDRTGDRTGQWGVFSLAANELGLVPFPGAT